MKSVLNNVIAVYVCQASDLDGMYLKKPDVVVIPDHDSWHPIMIQVPGKLTINNKVEDKNSLFATSLTFRTCEALTADGHPVYKVSLADGRQLLIGSSSRPYPVTTITESMPENLTDSQLNEVTVTLSSVARPPQIA